MARGRQQKWVCKDCKAEFNIQGRQPKLCCFCGSVNIGRAPSYALLVSYSQIEDQLAEVCKSLNPIYEKYSVLRKQYDQIMAYWKQQKRRGFISQEEYDRLASQFVGAQVKNDLNPEDTATP